MSAQICWIILASTAAGQAEPAASVELDADAFGLGALVDRTELEFEDREAYFKILSHLQDVNPRDLSQAAAELHHQRWLTVKDQGDVTEEDFSTFVDVFWHPQDYRGQPVTLRGHLIGPVISYSDENPFGLDPLYQAHLFDRGSQSNPATVIFTDLPPGIDLEADLITEVSMTGYFLKLHTYPSRNQETQIAPLLLARTIEIRTPAPAERTVPGWSLIGLVLAVTIIVLVVVLKTGRENRRVRNEYRERFESEPDFDASGVTLDD